MGGAGMNGSRVVSIDERPVVDSRRSDEVHGLLRHRILQLTLEPGSVFTLGQVTDEVGMSRTPVREALARLIREGLVISEPRMGYRVVPMTVKDAADLFAMRTMLEGESAALAASVGGDVEHLRELDALCQAEYDPADRDSISKFLKVNAEFHLAVARLGGNTRLTHALETVLEHLRRYMHLGLSLTLRAEEIVHEHRVLVGAILCGDVETARREAVDQAKASRRMVLDGLLSSEAVLSANLGVRSANARVSS
jgi:DNA-binding GntR family transcriptional regulator